MKKYIKYLAKKLIQGLFPSYMYLVRKNFEGIIFSFDDGPHPQHTPTIVTSLEKNNIKAIFFVTGKELEQHPDMGELIVQSGHILGNHTYEHLDLDKCSFKEYRRSIEKTNEIISLFQPREKKIFRPPYGRLSLNLMAYIVLSKTILMNWTVDSRDSFIRDHASLVDYVKDLLVVKGDILLFHEDYQHTVIALPEIIEHMGSNNTFSKLNELRK